MKFKLLLAVLIASNLYACRFAKSLSFTASEAPPQQKLGSEAAYAQWLRTRLYSGPQYHGQTDIKGVKSNQYGGDQYSIRIPKGQMSNDQALEFIQTMRDRPSGVYGAVTASFLGWPDQPAGSTLTPGQKLA